LTTIHKTPTFTPYNVTTRQPAGGNYQALLDTSPGNNMTEAQKEAWGHILPSPTEKQLMIYSLEELCGQSVDDIRPELPRKLTRRALQNEANCIKGLCLLRNLVTSLPSPPDCPQSPGNNTRR